VKSVIRLAAAAVLAAGFAAAAHAAEYTSIVQEQAVNAPADVTWAKVKPFCAIGPLLKTTCEITSGTDGELGAVRKIAGRVTEVLVAKTAMSYTYADPVQPILYHGTVEVVPTGKKTSKIIYSLFYDQAPTPEAQRQAGHDARAKTFAGVLMAMKAAAEAK
jgi:hypothetical protein